MKDLFYNSYYDKENDVYNLLMYNTETGEQYVKKIQKPKVSVYTVKGEVPNYYRETMNLKDLDEHRVSYKWRGFELAKILGEGDSFRRALKERKIKYDHIFLDRRCIGSDLPIEDLTIMSYLDSLGYEEKDGVKDYNDLPPIKNIKKGYYDIETDVLNIDEERLQPIICSTYYDAHTNTASVYSIIRDDFKGQKDIIKDEVKFVSDFKAKLIEHINDAQMGEKARQLLAPKFIKLVEEMKVVIHWFKEEKKMIEFSWHDMIYNFKPMFLGIYNAVYDIRHTEYRAEELGIDKSKLFCHKDVGNTFYFNYFNEDPKAAKRRHNYDTASYTKIICSQITYFGLRPQDQLERESLDAVAKFELGFGKLSYAHITDFIGRLPYLDFITYLMYNMIDVIDMAFLDMKTDDVNSLITRRFIVRTEYGRVFSPMTSVTNTFYHLCKRMGYIMANDVNKLIMTKNESAEAIMERLREADEAIESTYDVLTNRIQIAGGLCSDPNKFKKNMTPFLEDLVNNKFLRYVMDADAVSMYPMIIEHTNVSKDSLDGRIETVDKDTNKVEKCTQALISKELDEIGEAFFNLPSAKEIASKFYNIEVNIPKIRKNEDGKLLHLDDDRFKKAEIVRKILAKLDNVKIDASDIKAGILSTLGYFHIKNNMSNMLINGSLYEIDFIPDSNFKYKSLGDLFTLKDDEDGYIFKVDGKYYSDMSTYLKPHRFPKLGIYVKEKLPKETINSIQNNNYTIETIEVADRFIDVTGRTHIFLTDEDVYVSVYNNNLFEFEYSIKVPKFGEFKIRILSKTLQYRR